MTSETFQQLRLYGFVSRSHSEVANNLTNLCKNVQFVFRVVSFKHLHYDISSSIRLWRQMLEKMLETDVSPVLKKNFQSQGTKSSREVANNVWD